MIMSWTKPYTNLVPTAIDTDGSIYNGTGYIYGYRLNSSGGLTENGQTISTGFIPVKAGDLIRMAGLEVMGPGYNYICFYDASFTLLGSMSWVRSSDYANGYYTQCRGIVKYAYGDGSTNFPSEKNGVNIYDNYAFTDGSQVAYFRLNGGGLDGSKMVVTVNEEIISYSGTLEIEKMLYLYIDGIEMKKLELNGVQIWQRLSVNNKILSSINTDGTIYNDGLGYKTGYRVRSGGGEAESALCTCTGFIAVNPGDVVRIAGCSFDVAVNENAINVSNSTFTNIGQLVMAGGSYGIFTTTEFQSYSYNSVVKETDGIWKWIVPPANSGVAYIRINGYNYPEPSGGRLILTINEEIPY